MKNFFTKSIKRINYSGYNGKTLLLKESVDLTNDVSLKVGTPVKILGVNYVYVSAQVKIGNKIKKIYLNHGAIDWK